VNINKENKYGETPLFYACNSGKIDLVEYLVKHGADINKRNKYGNTPLFNACESGNKDLVEYFVTEYGVDIIRENETLLLMHAKAEIKI